MRASNPVYVVRQNAIGYVVSFALGLLFALVPWFIGDFGPLWGRLVVTGFGVLALTAVVFGWCTSRMGLAIDRCGIWCGVYALRGPVLISWADVRAARYVTWTNDEGEHDGILLEVRAGAEPPGRKYVHSAALREIEGLLGSLDFRNPKLLSQESWVWKPQELVDVIKRCIEDSHERNLLGLFANAHIARPTCDDQKVDSHSP
ncbi:MAG: hypothetical protein IH987_07035 [Planctomycetes bacterium]|nr:hypothetical protein [Planctomycetota bacterium]